MADWTDWNAHDPGVTTLELLAWTVGALAFAFGLYTSVKLAYGPRRCHDPG